MIGTLRRKLIQEQLCKIAQLLGGDIDVSRSREWYIAIFDTAETAEKFADTVGKWKLEVGDSTREHIVRFR